MPQSPTPTRSRRFTPTRLGLFFLIVVGLIAYDGNRRDPTPAASGDHFNPPAASTQPHEILRVATFNMAGGVGDADKRLDLSRTASAITGYDLVGLQEVHHGSFFATKNQAQILGESLKLPWLFAPVETRWWHEDFGNAALTDLPVLHWQRIPISSSASRTNRNLLLLRLTFNGKSVNVIITHLDRGSDHSAELETVLTLFESLEKPAILLADLNTEQDDKQLAKLVSMSNSIGINIEQKNAGLDWILAKGMHAVKSGKTNNGASDHELVWADLMLDSNKRD